MPQMDLYLHGCPLTVEFDYQPAETPYFNPAEGVGHPGCPADADIISVWMKTPDGEVEMYDLLSKKALDDLRALIVEKMEDEQ